MSAESPPIYADLNVQEEFWLVKGLESARSSCKPLTIATATVAWHIKLSDFSPEHFANARLDLSQEALSDLIALCTAVEPEQGKAIFQKALNALKTILDNPNCGFPVKNRENTRVLDHKLSTNQRHVIFRIAFKSRSARITVLRFKLVA